MLARQSSSRGASGNVDGGDAQVTEELRFRHGSRAHLMTDGVIYGTRGLLAYDELADRIQCHACGWWYQKITSFHLKRHGLTIPEYKEIYGLNDTTPLETPRLTALRRQQALDRDAARYLVPGANAAAAGNAVWRGRKHPAEDYKAHQKPADRHAHSPPHPPWTD